MITIPSSNISVSEMACGVTELPICGLGLSSRFSAPFHYATNVFLSPASRAFLTLVISMKSKVTYGVSCIRMACFTLPL